MFRGWLGSGFTFLNTVPASLTDNEDVLQCVAVTRPPLRALMQSSQAILHLGGGHFSEALLLAVP